MIHGVMLGITVSTVSGMVGTVASLPWEQRSSLLNIPVEQTACAKIPRQQKTKKRGAQYPGGGEVDSSRCMPESSFNMLLS